MERITAIARGRVYGMGYRYYVIACAERTGVVGYVQTLPDATVRIVAEGPKEALDAFRQLVRAEGDKNIGVEELAVTEGEATGEFSGFAARW